jgi:hypothetical protein
VSEAALQELKEAQAALIAALDSNDVEAIDTANAALAEAIEQVRVAGGWRERPGLRDDLVHILKVAEAARGRVNALADQNRRDLEKLINLAGVPRAVAYRRSGKLG